MFLPCFRFYAAFALGKLAQASQNHARIGRAGSLPALIALAHSEDNHAKCQAICMLRRLAMHADNRVATIEQGKCGSLWVVEWFVVCMMFGHLFWAY